MAASVGLVKCHIQFGIGYTDSFCYIITDKERDCPHPILMSV